MFLQVHIKSLSFFLIAENNLNCSVGEADKKVHVSLQLLFFMSLTHHTCLDPINAGRDEAARPYEKWKNVLMNQV